MSKPHYKQYCPKCHEEMKWVSWKAVMKEHEYFWCKLCRKELEEVYDARTRDSESKVTGSWWTSGKSN